MTTSYQYRLLRGASWGIAIDLSGESARPASPPASAVKITDVLWLQVDVGWPLGHEEVDFLKRGLGLVAGDIAARKRGTAPVLVRLTALEFNPTDYQPEGLAAAVAEWAAQEFGFPKKDIPVTFDAARGRYVFAFEGRDRHWAGPLRGSA